MKELVLQVKGMVCSDCEKRVMNALLELPNVEKVEASYESGIVKVFGSELVFSVIEEMISSLGFEVVVQK